MKKHPVDDLFGRKLYDLERKPSDNAWERIKSERAPKRGLGAWIWYAAASLIVGLLGGYLVWENDEQLFQSGRKQEIAQVKVREQEAKVDSKTKENTAIAALEKSALPEFAETKNSQKRNVAAVKENITAIQENVTYDNVATITNSEKVNVSTVIADEHLEPIATVSDLKIVHNEPAIHIEESTTEPARTIVVNVASADFEAEDKPKNTRFSRVFQQLKNARAGERVDWEEVGFNPRVLVARVDDRLKGKDDRNSEREHNSKERTKL